jgi:hypothetical protein
MISGNIVGTLSAPLRTIVLTDENGEELVGVITDSEVIFTATDNDVLEGKVYATDSGVSVGTLKI